MRMFVALIPPETVLADLAAAVQQRRVNDSGLRWTLREQWHVTLSFLPHVEEHQLDELGTRLHRAARRRESATLRVAGAVAFPRPARARVIGVGIDTDGSDELRRLATGARAAATRSGIQVVDAGRFHPHLTLARLRQPTDVRDRPWLLKDYRGPSWPLSKIALVQSLLRQGPDGRPRYELMQTFPVGRAD